MIKSYIGFSSEGNKDQLVTDLRGLKGCDVLPSTNKDVVVFVVEADNHSEEESIMNEIKSLHSLSHFSLVSGFSEKI